MSTECEACGGKLVESDILPEFVCSECEQTVPLPSGDDILFQDLIEMSGGQEQKA